MAYQKKVEARTVLAASKATPVDADFLPLVDSAASNGLKKLTWANLKSVVLTALGTPASGTLTNCTGLPVAGIVASTSAALGVGSVELGHASDTTVSRSAAGVAAVEGNPVSVRVSVPSTATAAGKPGYWAADASYFYAYTGDGSTHSWVRSAAAGW